MCDLCVYGVRSLGGYLAGTVFIVFLSRAFFLIWQTPLSFCRFARVVICKSGFHLWEILCIYLRISRPGEKTEACCGFCIVYCTETPRLRVEHCIESPRFRMECCTKNLRIYMVYSMKSPRCRMECSTKSRELPHDC